MNRLAPPPACPPKPGVNQWPLMSHEQALARETLFEVLANDTRLRLLHELARQGEACTSELADALERKPPAVCAEACERCAEASVIYQKQRGRAFRPGPCYG